jgi:xanthine dehydrogenase accessory factor
VRKEWESGESIVKVIVIKGPAELEGSEFSFKEKVLVFGDAARSHIQSLTAIADQIPKVEISQSLTLQFEQIGSIEIFVDVIQPPPTLVIVGGVHIAIPLVTLANALGYKTIIIDPRKKFGSRERFPHADRVINSWPEAAFKEIKLTSLAAVAILTHDPKIDDPALAVALPSPAFYVGALGSQKTQSQRRQRLLDLGLSHKEIDRLHGPIGLELGGSSPEEIALGIIAEVVCVRYQDQP